MTRSCDAVIIGAGPNGLAAAVALARAGRSVAVLEAADTIGGGCRSAPLTLPGFVHDICAAIHPMAAISPFLRTLPLGDHGLAWASPALPLAHPFVDGTAALLDRGLDAPSHGLAEDSATWQRLLRPFLRHADEIIDEVLRPIRLPRHPWLMARFGMCGLQSAAMLVRRRFRGHRAPALFGGCAAHSLLALDRPASASFGLVLALVAHANEWPCARGGSQKIVDALASHLRSLGGVIETNRPVRSPGDLPDARAVLFDLPPRTVEAIAGDELPAMYRRRLLAYRHGPGVFKMDWALSGPIPWTARECAVAATVHVGGTFEEIAAAEDAVANGRLAERPFVLVAQQSVVDPTRAPQGAHTGWAYCHVPHGSAADMTEAIERQIERFAPGFRDLILARAVMAPAALEAHNPNMIGGDIAGGANDLDQMLFRPFMRWDPYATPNPRFFLCSSSTPPGGGVHGMCGYWAAQSALRSTLA